MSFPALDDDTGPVYATLAQFRLRAPSAQAFTQTSDDVIEAALYDRSRYLDGYLSRKFILPLVRWYGDLTRAVVDMAAYDIMVTRGYNPETSDSTLRARFEDADRWAKSIPLNTTPQVIDSSGSTKPGENAVTPRVSSAEQRGFSSRPVQPGPGARRVWGGYVGD